MDIVYWTLSIGHWQVTIGKYGVYLEACNGIRVSLGHLVDHGGLVACPGRRPRRAPHPPPPPARQVVDQQVLEHRRLLPVVELPSEEDDLGVVEVGGHREAAPVGGRHHLHLLHLLPLFLLLLDCLHHAFNVILLLYRFLLL